jgi:hypothetical protein
MEFLHTPLLEKSATDVFQKKKAAHPSIIGPWYGYGK